MRRATVTIPDELEAGLDAYLERQDAPPTLTGLIQTALRTYLADRGYVPDRRTLRLTPAKGGSGSTNVSIEHDREWAER
jgi:hypothetical protein